jgi:alginate O-acetyltransferase complex protein AlgJ
MTTTCTGPGPRAAAGTPSASSRRTRLGHVVAIGIAALTLGLAGRAVGQGAQVGNDGWLIYTSPWDVGNVFDYRHRGHLSDAALADFSKDVDAALAGLAKRGATLVVAIVPNTPTIYPETMPRHIRPDATASRLEQLSALLVAKPAAHYVDLKAALWHERAGERLYMKTDTHWNERGAFVGYQAIMSVIAGLFPAHRARLQPKELTAFTLVRETGPGGDLARMLGLVDLLPEERLSLRPTVPRRATESGREGLSFATAMAEACPGPRLLVFRDSFASAMQPLLSEHFCAAKFSWVEPWPVQEVEQFKPDVVLLEVAERYQAHLIDGVHALAAALDRS